MTTDWKNKKIGVLGFGVEGLSSAIYFNKHGGWVTVLDERGEDEIDISSLKLIQKEGIEYYFGKGCFDRLDAFDVAIRTPGISVLRKELQDVKKKEVEVSSQVKVFMDLAPCPVIGVTGTKGKGTTASLIYEMLKKCGKHVYLGGNIGKPPLDFLDKLGERDRVVLELSSFQLQDLEKSPSVAVMLMTTSEHLDYHGDVGEYVEAKRNILRNQGPNDFVILNRDYPASNESDIFSEGKVHYVSRERETEGGCYAFGGKIWLDEGGRRIFVLSVKDLGLLGKHNLENVCAAVMAARLEGVDVEDIRGVLKSFKGLPHRLELVGEVGGVRYFDDSFSTTPETAIAGIEAFASEKDEDAREKLVLILGGSSKNSDFSELGKVIGKAENIRAIIGIGEEWDRIKIEILKQVQDDNGGVRGDNKGVQDDGLPLMIEGAKDMETVVKAANRIAKRGDVVLLSPGCASFGMFKNYKDRGEQFKREVERLMQ